MRPWEGYMEPFKIFGNLYFVGTTFVSCHVIDTGDGLVLIDSGYPQCTYLTLENIRKVGLDPYDIKYILLSHGHYDHVGGARAIRELTGAKTLIGRQDREYVNGTLDLTWAKEIGYQYYEEFEPDILIDDGYVFELGNTKIRCVNTPGHTPGVISFFFNVTDGVKTYTAGMFGGAGMNSLKFDFLDRYGLSYSCRDDYLNSLNKIRSERVDIHIGNHPGDNQTKLKYQKLISGEENPFIDGSSFEKWIKVCEQRLNKLIKSGL